MDAEKTLREIIQNELSLIKILEIVDTFKLPNYYVGAGAIAQIVWNYMHGYPSLNGIKDIDIVYYDSTDLTSESEKIIGENIRKALREFSIEFDVTNEARVHLWYEEEFGKKITQYLSTEDAISSWPTTATVIGLNLNDDGSVKIFSPFGLDDLVMQIVRANKKLIDKFVYVKKSERWKQIWPNLTIIDWES